MITELEERVNDDNARLERIRSAAENPANHESEETASWPSREVDRRRLSLPNIESPGHAITGALRTIERYSHSGDLRSTAADTLDRLVQDPKDLMGLGARYIEAVGDPDYHSAFGKLFDDPMTGHLRMTREETAAIEKVSAVEQLRGLVTGTGSAGGFALPIVIDPSIMLTSSGALNPIRQRARVITTNTTEWRGVSSAGVTASYDPEASEVSDDTPTLAQPTILTEMARAFVPFSIEVGQDWGSLQTELLTLIADARDVLDATKFYSGTGTDEPNGVITGLTTTQRVQTAGAGAFALGDVYSLKQAVPARFFPNASFAWHPNRIDTIYRFVGGNSTEPPVLPTRDGPLLGKPNDEWSAIPTASTTGTKIGLCGDFNAGYTIVDRIGMQAELVPHLFGASQRPTGQRGIFAFWRTGAKVVVPEALRYLEAL
jgi:HK97 family phage major capsid protein